MARRSGLQGIPLPNQRNGTGSSGGSRRKRAPGVMSTSSRIRWATSFRLAVGDGMRAKSPASSWAKNSRALHLDHIRYRQRNGNDQWCGRGDSNPHFLPENGFSYRYRFPCRPNSGVCRSGLSLHHSLWAPGAARLVSTPSRRRDWLGISIGRTGSLPRI